MHQYHLHFSTASRKELVLEIPRLQLPRGPWSYVRTSNRMKLSGAPNMLHSVSEKIVHLGVDQKSKWADTPFFAHPFLGNFPLLTFAIYPRSLPHINEKTEKPISPLEWESMPKAHAGAGCHSGMSP